MSKLLGNHPDVFSFQELHFFDELLPAGKVEVIPSNSKSINLYATLCAIQRNGYFGSRKIKPFSDEAAAVVGNQQFDYLQLFEKFLEAETKRNGKKIPCEQTPQTLYAIDTILEKIPDARFIIMVRDPREVLLSQKYKYRRRKLSGGKIPLREAVRAWINYHPVTICKLWKAAADITLSYKENPAVKIIRFEDLLLRPEETLKNVCTHCDISFSETMFDIPVAGSSQSDDSILKRGIDASKLNQWEKGGLNNSEISLCLDINGKLMQKFGYKIRPENGNPVMKAWYRNSVPFHLGVALLFNLKRLKNVDKLVKRFF